MKNDLKTILRRNRPKDSAKPYEKMMYMRNPIILVIIFVIFAFGIYKFFNLSWKENKGLVANQSIDKEKLASNIQSGVDDLNNGKIDDAEKKLDEVLQKDKNNIDATYNFALVKYTKHQYDEAINYLNRLIKLDPKNPESYIILGNISRDLKKIDEAASYYHKASEVDSKYIFAYTNSAIMLMENNRRGDARLVASEGLKNNPESVELKNLQNILKK